MSAPEAPPQRPLVSDLHQHLICVLCRGYLVEATAIVECLHSFCRSCIVRNLATSKYCPVCDVAITTAKPSLCIRPDEILQRLVYKIVPNLFEDELKRRKCFYADQPPEERTNPKAPLVQLCHNYRPPSSSRLRRGRSSEATSHGDDRRYLSCPARMTIGQLKKFIQMKFDLTENLNVEIFFKDECMKNVYTLVDAAYITKWNMVS
ncbi:hypothetical protein CAPTEDRAFT_128199 [Capitella teleta]|uniref:RING-type domain-containing protein n=1 Tax=Capitella teleta TaxID=283909 RepID=R7VGM1_CAPTE|nr:hypothetical protein CAPTEDRAFT_128199 [Capitella teleta]|eukprot:ELU14840.1 hypothetical protein CAPTEDRAFT_128199 [Capitella teleta]